MMKQEEAYILSYIKGTLNKEDTAIMDQLYRTSPEFRKDVKDVAFINGLLQNAAQQKNIDPQSGWIRLKNRIEQNRSKILTMRWISSAAAVIIVGILSWQLIFRVNMEGSSRFYNTVTASPSSINKVILPDGSEVWLNASSTLRYPKKFVPGNRTVELEGEGYFKVVSDKKNRFDVLLKNGTKVSAYGTEFNISAYANEKRYSVLLTKGHVDVFIPEAKQTESLKAGEEVVLATSTTKPEVRIKPAENMQMSTAWKDGKLVFYRKTLGHIAGVLSKRFDVTIEFADSVIVDQEYTATFDNENMNEILDLLKQAGKLDYTIINQNTKDSHDKRTKIIFQKTE